MCLFLNGNLEKLIESTNKNSYIQMTGKVFANILRLTFCYPWTKSLGKSSVNLLTWAKGQLHSAARGTKAAASEIPVIRGGVLLANDQMEFPRRPADNLWSSKSAVWTSALHLAA